MALSQQKFRELLFQLLYSHDLAEPCDEDMEEMLMKQLGVTKRAVRLAQGKRRAITEKLEELDQRIAQASHAYAFHRIPRIERNILRLGLYELLHAPSTPPKVAIAEAIRLARKFATRDSASFVNAVLDGLYKATNPPPTE